MFSISTPMSRGRLGQWAPYPHLFTAHVSGLSTSAYCIHLKLLHICSLYTSHVSPHLLTAYISGLFTSAYCTHLKSLHTCSLHMPQVCPHLLTTHLRSLHICSLHNLKSLHICSLHTSQVSPHLLTAHICPHLLTVHISGLYYACAEFQICSILLLSQRTSVFLSVLPGTCY